jgi:hypothetical protein
VARCLLDKEGLLDKERVTKDKHAKLVGKAVKQVNKMKDNSRQRSYRLVSKVKSRMKKVGRGKSQMLISRLELKASSRHQNNRDRKVNHKQSKSKMVKMFKIIKERDKDENNQHSRNQENRSPEKSDSHFGRGKDNCQKYPEEVGGLVLAAKPRLVLVREVRLVPRVPGLEVRQSVPLVQEAQWLVQVPELRQLVRLPEA